MIHLSLSLILKESKDKVSPLVVRVGLGITIRSFLVKHHSKNSFADQNEALGPPFSKCCVAVDLIRAPIPSQGSFPCSAALNVHDA